MIRKPLHASPRLALVFGWLAALAAGCAGTSPPIQTAPAAAATAPALERPSVAAPKGAPPLKIAFAYVGPVGDAGWSYAHDSGRRAVEKAFGNRVHATYVESVPENRVAEDVMQRMVKEGNSLIFGTSFGYMDPMLKVAAEHKNVRFEHGTGFKTAPNMRTYDSRMYEGAYLAGIVAGAATKSNVLGVVGAVPIPEIVRNINSFTLGAQSVNPKITTRVEWTGSWFHPQKEAAATQKLIDQNADVVFQNTDSSAVLQTAEKNGKLAIGWVSDMSRYGPNAHLASAVIDWGPYYVKSVRDVIDGTWSTGDAWWGVEQGAIDIVSLSPKVSAEARERVARAKAGLKDRSFHPWRGPIADQSGKTVVAAGTVASDRFLLAMNFYVRGVQGQVPR